jgi:hypothetical protein
MVLRRCRVVVVVVVIVIVPIQRRALLHDAGALALAENDVGGTVGPPARRRGDCTTSLLHCGGGVAGRARQSPIWCQHRALVHDTCRPLVGHWPPSSSWRVVVCRCGAPLPLWWVGESQSWCHAVMRNAGCAY